MAYIQKWIIKTICQNQYITEVASFCNYFLKNIWMDHIIEFVTLIRLAESQVYFNKYDIIIFLASKQDDFFETLMFSLLLALNSMISIN